MNLGPVWRITPPELLSPAKPECCEGLWEDVSNPTTNTGLDPILWTDQKTGRTFVSNSTAGANAVYGYSDNDGDLWVPLAASPASGGTDHETIGTGPYPASLSLLGTPVNQGQAVYYCSQTWPLGPATCQRSDDLGASYGPGVLAYEGNGITQCHGLNGHVHVAPDGTVWALGAVSLFTDASSEMIYPLLPLLLTGALGAGVASVGLIEGAAEGVASLLKLPVRTLYAWRTRGEGPRGFRAGRHVRYRRSEVLRWVAAQEANEPNPAA